MDCWPVAIVKASGSAVGFVGTLVTVNNSDMVQQGTASAADRPPSGQGMVIDAPGGAYCEIPDEPEDDDGGDGGDGTGGGGGTGGGTGGGGGGGRGRGPTGGWGTTNPGILVVLPYYPDPQACLENPVCAPYYKKDGAGH